MGKRMAFLFSDTYGNDPAEEKNLMREVDNWYTREKIEYMGTNAKRQIVLDGTFRKVFFDCLYFLNRIEKQG